VLEPNFVVLDEPTRAPTCCLQAQMVDYCVNAAQARPDYMFISHDLRVVASLGKPL